MNNYNVLPDHTCLPEKKKRLERDFFFQVIYNLEKDQRLTGFASSRAGCRETGLPTCQSSKFTRVTDNLQESLLTMLRYYSHCFLLKSS